MAATMVISILQFVDVCHNQTWSQASVSRPAGLVKNIRVRIGSSVTEESAVVGLATSIELGGIMAGKSAELAIEMGLIVIAATVGNFLPAGRLISLELLDDLFESQNTSEPFRRDADLLAKQSHELFLAWAEFL
jgi:hypothetical protein